MTPSRQPEPPSDAMLEVETRKFWLGAPSLFVLCRTGLTIHIADNELTRCGRQWLQQADADDVLYFPTCQKCRGAFA